MFYAVHLGAINGVNNPGRSIVARGCDARSISTPCNRSHRSFVYVAVKLGPSSYIKNADHGVVAGSR
jgi:hypothetical protein